MVKIRIVLGVVAILLIAFFALNTYIYTEKQADTARTTYSTYANPSLGFLFSYKIGAEGYILTEPEIGEVNSSLQKIIVLTGTEDVLRLEVEPFGGEGPPTITILVFDNPKKQSPIAWAKEQTLYSSIGLKREEPKEFVIGEVSGIRYMADGLYASEIVIFAHGSRLYVFNGGYIDASSHIRSDFKALIESVTFLP